MFDVTSLAEARHIILTPEADGFDTDRRWEEETPYLASLITSELGLTAGSLVLDYGCGIGRLSRALIEESGCSVVGVDTSQNMRMLALRYVNSPRFTAVAPEMLDTLVQERGLLFDRAIAVWVLQHCPHVEDDIQRIREGLRTGGKLFVLNERGRCVPTDKGWIHDGKNTDRLLGHAVRSGSLPPAVASAACSDRTYWAVY